MLGSIILKMVPVLAWTIGDDFQLYEELYNSYIQMYKG